MRPLTEAILGPNKASKSSNFSPHLPIQRLSTKIPTPPARYFSGQCPRKPGAPPKKTPHLVLTPQPKAPPKGPLLSRRFAPLWRRRRRPGSARPRRAPFLSPPRPPKESRKSLCLILAMFGEPEIFTPKWNPIRFDPPPNGKSLEGKYVRPSICKPPRFFLFFFLMSSGEIDSFSNQEGPTNRQI